jgi:chromosome segregation ATPase
MKAAILPIVLLVLCGAALGGYMLFREPRAISDVASTGTGSSSAASSSGSGSAGTGEILELRGEIGLLREKHQQRIERLETEVSQQAEEIGRLKKELAAARAGLPPATADNSEGAPTSSPAARLSLQDADRETLKELLGELSEERRQDEFRQREERMREEMAQARQRQIDSLAEKYEWDEQKKQQVLDILTRQSEKTDSVRQTLRDDNQSPESREQFQTQIRAIRDETQKALAELLTEEELQELQRVTRPARRERGTGRRSRFPSGQQPGGGRR